MGTPIPNNSAVKRSKRVLLVSPQPFYETRGTPIAVRHVLGALTELGFQIDVLTYPIGETVTLPDVRIFRTPNPLGFHSIPIGLSFRKVFLDVMLLILYVRRIRRSSYDYIHVLEEFAFPVALAGRPAGNYVIYDMASSLPEQLSRSVLFGNRIAQKILRALEKRVFAGVDHVACSAGLAAYVKATCPAAHVTEWFYPVSVDTRERSNARTERRSLQVAGNSPVVMYLGSFAPYQGIEQLLEAAQDVLQRLPNVVFVLVGATPKEQMHMQRKLDPAVRSHIRFIGRVRQERAGQLINIADVLVSPRLFGRNTPLKIMEYIATGKPIVASDNAAHRTFLDETRAVLVECTPLGLAAGITRVLRDEEFARRIGQAARVFAAENFSWPRFVAHVERIYRAADRHHPVGSEPD